MNKTAKTYRANIQVTFVTADHGKDAAEAIADAINALGVLSGDEFVDDTEITVEHSTVDTVVAESATQVTRGKPDEDAYRRAARRAQGDALEV